MESKAVPADVRQAIYDHFRTLGEVQSDGRSFLTEVTVRLEEFKVVIRPNESQHRGRPHCLIEMGPDSATFDIATGKLLAGSLKRWNRTAEKVVLSKKNELLKVWNDTRPDDQKLKR